MIMRSVVAELFRANGRMDRQTDICGETAPKILNELRMGFVILYV